jgi:hypothetical protein
MNAPRSNPKLEALTEGPNAALWPLTTATINISGQNEL